MDSQAPFLSVTEAKNKELVPLVRGIPLHSLHNPRREAEVFANNHLAHLSKTENVLVLGLGFGYHLEEMAKILRLRNKGGRVVVIEALPEMVRLWSSYQKNTCGAEVYSACSVDELYQNRDICQFLLSKPVVIIHQASFQVARDFYQQFLQRRSSNRVRDLRTQDAAWNAWIAGAGDATIDELQSSTAAPAKWLRTYWEFKHAE